MIHKRLIFLISIVLIFLATSFTLSRAHGEGTIAFAPNDLLGSSFSYQGYLTDGDAPANGVYDFEFMLFDSDVEGILLGTFYADDENVADGLFRVQIDFGSGVFDGDARWLEIGVRPGDETDAYMTLEPRQAITPAPHALFALEAGGMDWAGLSNIPFGLDDGDDDSLAVMICDGDQVLKYDGSNWICANDGGGTSYTAGFGLNLAGSEFSVDTSEVQDRVDGTCPAGQSIRAVDADGSVTCEPDDDTDTTYTAGTGLDLVGTEFSVDFKLLADAGQRYLCSRLYHPSDQRRWQCGL